MAGVSASGWSTRRQATVFVVLACGLSWSWWIPMAARGDITRAGQGWPTHLVGLVGPAVAAVVTAALAGGKHAVVELIGRCARWRVPAVGCVAVGGAVVLAFAAALFADDADDALIFSGAPRIGVLVVPYVLVLNGFGEELGWRGFLVPLLRGSRSLRDTALLVWIVWGVWHVPLFWVVADFRDFTVAETAGWAIGLFFGSVLLAWLVEAAHGSVLAVALWHTAYNFATATEAAEGAVAAVATTAVIAATVWIMRRTTIPSRSS